MTATQNARRRVALKKDERIVTAWAEPADGPGWSNTPLWFLIRDGATGVYRTEALQPAEYVADVTPYELYAISSICHRKLTDAVERLLRGRP